jgi:hypothetical protein
MKFFLLVNESLLFPVEAGSNTSTVDLRVVEGEVRETGCLGPTLSLGDINTEM